MSADLESMGIAVGIPLLSCSRHIRYFTSTYFLHGWAYNRWNFVAIVYRNWATFNFVFFSRHHGFLTSGFMRHCFWWCHMHWKVYPRKQGQTLELCFYHVGIAELLGGGNFTTPLRRYKIRSAVGGLNPVHTFRSTDTCHLRLFVS